jgi:uncharacterized protein YndB with AHSA1/START domain
MIRFQTEETIDRPAHAIWSYAADISHHAEWMGVIDSRLVSGHATDIGARGVERMKLGPRTYEVGFEVSKSIPAQRIAWRMDGGSPFTGEVTLDLEALGPDRTRAVWSGAIGLTGWWRLIEPLIATEVRTSEAGELRRLKASLEMAPATASTGEPATS